MKQVCKCHGVSGSCSVKVCWKVMPEFRLIGDELYRRYNHASQIRDVEIKNRVKKLKMIVTRRSLDQVTRTQTEKLKDQLIYVDKSPNFCRKEPKYMTLGTSGRMCQVINSKNKQNIFYAQSKNVSNVVDYSGLQNCDYLCCGRGYYSKIVEVVEDCDCQFQWCCSVKCKKCKKKIIQYFCN